MAVLKRLDESIILENSAKSIKELVSKCLKNGISLNEADLENADLSGVSFDDAFICKASFKGANLNEISSKNASFMECDFSRASFHFCNFLRTNFEGCDFKNADLRDCIGDMKHIFSVAVDTYVLTFTNEMMNLGCKNKSIKEWRETTSDMLEDEEQKWLWEYYKSTIFQMIDKRLGVKND